VTVSPDRKPVVVSDLDEAIAAVRRTGLRLTASRRLVLEGLGDREYLACESCGLLESVEPAALETVRDAVRDLSGFEASFSHFPIVGLCARCAQKRRG